MFAKKDIIGQWDDRRLITTIYYFRIPVVDVNVYQHQDLLRNKYLGPPANRIVPNAQGINIPNSLGWMDNRIETGKKLHPLWYLTDDQPLSCKFKVWETYFHEIERQNPAL